MERAAEVNFIALLEVGAKSQRALVPDAALRRGVSPLFNCYDL